MTRPASPGGMSERMRRHDWAATPLGPPAQWPQSLQTVVRLMLDSRYAMWMAWGPELTFFCNDAYAPTLGLKRDWALGARTDRVWAEIWTEVGPRVERVLRTGVATWDEGLQLFLNRSGYLEETYHTFSYSAVRDDDGAVAGLLCVVTEETERRVNERRLKVLRELAARSAGAVTVDQACQRAVAVFGHCRADLPFCCLYLVDATTGVARLACFSGEPTAAARPEHVALDDDGATWPCGAAVRSGAAQRVHGLRARVGTMPMGPWEDAVDEAIVVPVRGAGRDSISALLVAGFSTRRPVDAGYLDFVGLVANQVAAALGDAQAYEDTLGRAEALAALDRAKTVFFSDISHEFRTPLMLMTAPLEEVLQGDCGPLPAPVIDRLGLAHRNSLRLLRLVNSLLDFSRIEAGRMEARPEPVDLATMTSEVASMFRSTVEAAGLRLEIDCEPLAEPVQVDRGMWEKIVLNLLSNAYKHTLAGSITVRVARVPEGVQLVVADTGIGIPPEALPHLFERFYRMPQPRARTIEGSGIGLALVHELLQLHGGSIEVRSEVDRGSIFSVTLPNQPVLAPVPRAPPASRPTLAARAPNAATYGMPTPAPRRAAPSVAAAPPGARTVLIADDNADMRDYLIRLLSPHYTILAATDGLEALRLAREHRPDLVLSDVMMPRLDGLGLLEALRADAGTRDIPIALLSARAGEEARIEGIDAGADDYLVKPFSARELTARVASLLELARMRRELGRVSRESDERLAFLLSLSDALRAQTSSEGVVQCALERLGRQFGAAGAGYGEVDEAGAHLVVAGHWTVDPTATFAVGRRLPVDDPAETRALREGGTLHIDDASSSASAALWASLGIGAVVAVPCMTDGHYSAALWVSHATARSWRGDEIRLLRETASRVWTEVARARAETVLRESEERFRTLADSSPVPVWVVDGNGDALFLNRGWREFAGVDATALPRAQWTARLHPDDAPAYLTAVETALARRERLAITSRVQRIDGTWRWWQSNAAPRFSATGDFLGLVGTSIDVTEQIESERSKDEFLAVLAHELRNPLAPIRQAAWVGRLPHATPEQLRHSQEVIERQVGHMALLLEDLLDVSRIAGGRLALKRQVVSIAEVIANARETVQSLMDERQHRLTVELPDEAVLLDGDPLRLSQVLSNLLTNAVKYSGHGGHTRLSVWREAGEAVIRVKDGGIGIDAQTLPRLFERFSRAPGAIERAEGGLGIGLALVKQLVELHGGRVEAHSAGPGHGAEFIVRLPLKETTAAPAEAAPEPPPTVAAPATPLRVLIADDARDAADSLALLLSLQGCETSVAHDGASALAALEASTPDVALLDIGMPGLSGLEIARRTRRSTWGTQLTIVAVSGWGRPEDKAQAVEAGFDHHLTKPVDLAALFAILDHVRPAGRGAGRAPAATRRGDSSAAM